MAVLTISKRLKAFSVTESIVTMVVLLSVFFTVMHFLATVNESSPGAQRIKAASVLNTHVQQRLEQKEFTNSRVMVNNWTISTESVPYSNAEGIMQVSFTIYKREAPETPIITRTLLVTTAVSQ